MEETEGMVVILEVVAATAAMEEIADPEVEDKGGTEVTVVQVVEMEATGGIASDPNI
jgi:hypothetical protein